MSKLTREQVLKLAALSKLKLRNEEIEKFQKELGEILDYVEQLNDVDVEGLEPSYQVTGLKNVFRSDEIGHTQATPEELMSRVPKKKDGYILVGRMV